MSRTASVSAGIRSNSWRVVNDSVESGTRPRRDRARRVLDGSVAPPTESAAATAAAPAAAATAGLALLRLTHVDLPPADVAAVQLLDRLAGLAGRAHLDESKSARAAGVAVV